MEKPRNTDSNFLRVRERVREKEREGKGSNKVKPELNGHL